MTSNKIIEKFKIFYKKASSQQQPTVKEFIFLKLKRSYKTDMNHKFVPIHTITPQ
jgi:hypothetical protein